MKFRPTCAAAALVGTSLLLPSGIRCTQAAEIKVVSPGAYADKEGEGSASNCCPPFRYQQVLPAADFAALGNQPHWLVNIVFRPDQSLTSPQTFLFPDNEYRLATTQRGPNNLSLRFDDNLGSDFMLWYRGPVTVMAAAPGPGPGPRQFNNSDRPAGVRAYLFDPSQGNLLMDVIGWQGVSPSLSEDQVLGMQTALYASNPLATQGNRSNANIFQFTFVPVTPGDYHRDGTVDAADYVVWRSGLGTTYTQADYDTWRTNFGQTIGGGGALPSAEPLSIAVPEPLPAVPEPSTALLVIVGSLALAARWRPTHFRLRRKIEGEKMTHWQAWMACGLLLSLPAAAQADIFRWDNGELIPGTEGITPGPGVDLSQRGLYFANFSGGLDLTWTNFSLSWLDHSAFSGANLTNADFEGAILRGANLSGANLADARVLGTYLAGANLSGTTLTGAYFPSSTLTSANFEGAVVAGADFGRFSLAGLGSGITLPQLYSTSSYQQRNLRGIGLSDHDLTGVDFSGQDLTGADLRGSTLTSANFAGAVVARANFDRFSYREFPGSGINLPQLYSTSSYEQRNLRGIVLRDHDLTGGDFSGQDLTGADLVGSTLTSANFTGAVVARADFARILFSYSPQEFLGSGINLPQLYSTASYQEKNLRGIGLGGHDLTGGDFSGHDLTGANFDRAMLTSANLSGTNLTAAKLAVANLANANLSGSNLTDAQLDAANLTNANLAGAIVTGARFVSATFHGFTKEQLYSTASYQQKKLRGIGLSSNNLTGWDFSGQDLAGASFGSTFDYSTLTNANFSFADLRGAVMPSVPIQLARNTIRKNGAINGLDLAAGETLVVRDCEIGITVFNSMNAVSGGTLELVLGDADWGSTMAVAAGITPDLGGTLRVRFTDQANLASMVGTTFDFFDWPAVLESNNRFDAIDLPPGTRWDLSQLYVTGTATLTAIPEPSAVLLLACGIVAAIASRSGRCDP
jgi:uncharacterized protein YjbI with pentapeptide repeats